MIEPKVTETRAAVADVNDRLRRAFDHLITEVLGHPAQDWSTGPAAHGLQAMMRDAAVEGDVAKIAALHDRFAAILERAEAGPLSVVPFGAPDLGEQDRALLQYAFADDVGLTTALCAPDPKDTDRIRAEVAALAAGLASATPDWWAEFTALVRLIVLARTDTPGARFGGASSFAAWGAILVNPSSANRLALAMTLIHESSHLKLFLAYLDDEIVLNDPDEGYSSPLRREPRPMNGIYHAAFVLARMARFGADLLASGQAGAVLGAELADELRDKVAAYIAQFDEGHAVITEHGRLTPKGAALIAEAAAALAPLRHAPQPA